MSRDKNLSYNVALSGIITALSMIMMFLTTAIPVGSYIFPTIAGIFIWVVKAEINTRWALLCYISTGLLSFIMTPDVEAKMMFIFILGYYPIARDYIHQLKSKVLRLVLKLSLFNSMVLIAYFIIINLFGMAELMEEFQELGEYSLLILMGMANFAFICFDFLMGYIIIDYHKFLKPKIRR